MAGARKLLGHSTESMTRIYVRNRVGKKVSPGFDVRLCQARKSVIMAKRFAIPQISLSATQLISWRRGSESNRRPRLCRPLHNHSATPPLLPQPNGLVAPLQRNRETQKLKRENGFRQRRMSFTRWPYAKGSIFPVTGAGNEARTRDPNLGKVVLYH